MAVHGQKVRHISVEMHDRPAFVYFLGQVRRLPIDGKDVSRTICAIDETETHYVIYIAGDEVAQRWKDIPKTDKVTVEYAIV